MISAVVSNSLHRLKYLSSRPRPKLIRLLGKLCRRKIASCDQVGLRGYESVRGRHLIGYAIVLDPKKSGKALPIRNKFGVRGHVKR